jgi:predicted nucleic acid-binding Zn ribbon protein
MPFGRIFGIILEKRGIRINVCRLILERRQRRLRKTTPLIHLIDALPIIMLSLDVSLGWQCFSTSGVYYFAKRWFEYGKH